jgi:hypothetical protein
MPKIWLANSGPFDLIEFMLKFKSFFSIIIFKSFLIGR